VAEQTQMRHALIEAIHRLPERERVIIRLYYVESQSLKSIGQALAISESRTSQLRHRAIRRLRTALTGGLDAAA
jgi:RNA polymerase sigma factor for flagellar operon FliA